MSNLMALQVAEEAEDIYDMGEEQRSISQRVDKVIYLLEGEENIPGLVKRVANLEELLLGQRGNDGMAHQVRAMWRIYVWILCSFSALIGYLIHNIADKVLK